MVEYLNSSKMIHYLEESGILFPGGYGKGLPVYSSVGLGVINQFIDTFRNELKRSNIKDVLELKHKTLIEKNAFINAYKGINDYTDEIVEYNGHLILSDILIESVAKLNNTHGSKGGSVLSVSSVFRDKNDKLIPLFKDKNIFPVVQIDQIIQEEDFYDNIDELKRIFKNFFRKIGIKVAFLEAKEVPKYADYELYFITHHNGKLTKLGMVYALSKQFKRNLKIDERFNFFDSGFSGKALYKSLELSSSCSGEFLIHPNIANVDLLIAKSPKLKTDKGIIARLTEEGFNVRQLSDTKKSYKIWRKSGVLHYILIHDHFTLFTKNTNEEIKEEFFRNTNDLINKVIEEKSKTCLEIYNKSESLLETIKENYTESVCNACYKKEFYGYYIEDKEYSCNVCGDKITKRILNLDPNKRFY